MQKRASILALIGAHLAQNIAGQHLINSESFHQSLSQNFIAGATARKAHFGTAKEHLKSVGLSVAVPEGAIMENQAYKAGQKLYKNLRLQGIDTNKLHPRHAAMIRMELSGKGHVLDRMGHGKSPLISTVRKTLGEGIIGGRPDYSVLHSAAKLPMGNMLPHNPKIMAASNAAFSLVDHGTAALNAGKLAMETKAFTNSRVGKWVDHTFVHKPLKDALDKGAAGIDISGKLLTAKKYLMNGAMGQLEENANKFGATHKLSSGMLENKVSRLASTAKLLSKLHK